MNSEDFNFEERNRLRHTREFSAVNKAIVNTFYNFQNYFISIEEYWKIRFPGAEAGVQWLFQINCSQHFH